MSDLPRDRVYALSLRCEDQKHGGYGLAANECRECVRIIDAAFDATVRDERERCARVLCPACRDGVPLDGLMHVQTDGRAVYTCIAAVIREGKP